jgi:exodeoxyribonuclease VII small subunit
MNESPADELAFEDALSELEGVVRDLEDGQVGLEQSLARYERGVGLIKRCYAQLREAEQRILLVTGTDEAGKPTLQPFQHTATDAEVKRPAARRRANDSPLRFEPGGERP